MKDTVVTTAVKHRRVVVMTVLLTVFLASGAVGTAAAQGNCPTILIDIPDVVPAIQNPTECGARNF